MPITCICPQCQKTLAIGDEFAGQPMRCPLCMALFQAPASLPAEAVQQNQPAAATAGAGGAAHWQAPGDESQLPHGPIWGGIGEGRGKRSSGSAGADLNGVRAAGGVRLEPGWHMVRRGLTIIPLSLFAVYAVLMASSIILWFTNPGSDLAKTVQLVSIPVVILAAVGLLLGSAMCCLIPEQGTARKFALAATGCLLAFLVVGLFTFAVTSLASKPADKPASGNALSVFVSLAFLPAGLLLLGGCVLFLFFLRHVAEFFQLRRLAQGVQWCAGFLAASPFVLLFLLLLLRMTSRAIGGDGSGLAILESVVVSLVLTVDLFWFLRAVRELQRAVTRAYVATAG